KKPGTEHKKHKKRTQEAQEEQKKLQFEFPLVPFVPLVFRSRFVVQSRITARREVAALSSTPPSKRNLQGLGRTDALIHSDREERREHFLPRHIALVNSPVGIGIEFVVRGVVIVANNHQLRPLRDLNGLG